MKTTRSIVACFVMLAIPSFVSAEGNRRWLKSAEPTADERKAVDWVLNRPDKHRRTSVGSFPELIRVRTPKGVRGVGVFSKALVLTGVETNQSGRELFFSEKGKHVQTNLVSEKGVFETTRAFRRGRWHHTNVWNKKTGRTVHYTPRKGSRSSSGAY